MSGRCERLCGGHLCPGDMSTVAVTLIEFLPHVLILSQKCPAYGFAETGFAMVILLLKRSSPNPPHGEGEVDSVYVWRGMP